MKKSWKICSACALMLLVAGVAFASEGGEHGGIDAGMIKNLVLRTVNFIIFAGLIWYLGGKKFKEFFSGRRYQIETELDSLTRRQAEAKARLEETEKKIANLETERQRLMAEFQAQGEALKEAIVAKAEKTAESIKAQAKLSAEQETKVAIENLRSTMADMVADAAQKMIEKKLSAQEHDRLVNDYLTKVVLN